MSMANAMLRRREILENGHNKRLSSDIHFWSWACKGQRIEGSQVVALCTSVICWRVRAYARLTALHKDFNDRRQSEASSGMTGVLSCWSSPHEVGCLMLSARLGKASDNQNASA